MQCNITAASSSQRSQERNVSSSCFLNWKFSEVCSSTNLPGLPLSPCQLSAPHRCLPKHSADKLHQMNNLLLLSTCNLLVSFDNFSLLHRRNEPSSLSELHYISCVSTVFLSSKLKLLEFWPFLSVTETRTAHCSQDSPHTLDL